MCQSKARGQLKQSYIYQPYFMPTSLAVYYEPIFMPNEGKCLHLYSQNLLNQTTQSLHDVACYNI